MMEIAHDEEQYNLTVARKNSVVNMRTSLNLKISLLLSVLSEDMSNVRKSISELVNVRISINKASNRRVSTY
jgi:hypothetical protein